MPSQVCSISSSGTGSGCACRIWATSWSRACSCSGVKAMSLTPFTASGKKVFAARDLLFPGGQFGMQFFGLARQILLIAKQFRQGSHAAFTIGQCERSPSQRIQLFLLLVDL